MSSSFKIKLKRAPHAPQGTASSPAPPDSSPAPPSTSGGLHDYTDDETGDEEGTRAGEEEEMDELEGEEDELELSSHSSPHPSSSPISGRGGASGLTLIRGGMVGSFPLKRPSSATQLSLQEVDSLPTAKRRRSHKARGASGPGRGWRKGLKMGQKPVYEPPLGADGLPLVPVTPSSFAEGSSRGATPSEDGSVAPRTNVPSVLVKPVVGAAAAAKPVAQPSPSAAASAEDLQQVSFINNKPGATVSAPLPKATANVRYPALPGIRGGPSILPLGRIPVAFANTTLPRKERTARKWTSASRQILSLGGRAWSAKTWFASERPRFPTAAETTAMLAAQRATAEHSPQPPVFSQAGSGKSSHHASATPLRAPAGSSPLAMRTPKQHPGMAHVTASASGASSPDWRGSSPAFHATVKKPPS